MTKATNKYQIGDFVHVGVFGEVESVDRTVESKIIYSIRTPQGKIYYIPENFLTPAPTEGPLPNKEKK